MTKVILTVWSMLAVVERSAELATVLLQTGDVLFQKYPYLARIQVFSTECNAFIILIKKKEKTIKCPPRRTGVNR